MKHSLENYKGYVIQKRIDVPSNSCLIHYSGGLVKCIAGDILRDGSENSLIKAKRWIDNKLNGVSGVQFAVHLSSNYLDIDALEYHINKYGLKPFVLNVNGRVYWECVYFAISEPINGILEGVIDEKIRHYINALNTRDVHYYIECFNVNEVIFI